MEPNKQQLRRRWRALLETIRATDTRTCFTLASINRAAFEIYLHGVNPGEPSVGGSDAFDLAITFDFGAFMGIKAGAVYAQDLFGECDPAGETWTHEHVESQTLRICMFVERD